MLYCGNCGAEIDETKAFCRLCGASTAYPPDSDAPGQFPPSGVAIEEATTWRLPATTGPAVDMSRPTAPVTPVQTNQPAPYASPTYLPPPGYLVPQAPPYGQPTPGAATVSLGSWLSGGWQVYKENWFVMSLASLIGFALGSVTIGILAGPLLMGMFNMAFKTMRGERPELSDLFSWKGKFLQAFLAFLISTAIYGGITGAGNNSPFLALVGFVITPFLTLMLGFVMPMLLERKTDVAAAINVVSKTIFTRDIFMWWVAGLVFATIIPGGLIACGIGFFVTLPWIISSSAVAYRDLFGVDDPNRTLH